MAGDDGICSTIINAIANVILEPLVYCINLSLPTGRVTELIKIAKILPIHKSGDKNDINNYRPLSILPTLSRVLERVMYNRLNGYFNTNWGYSPPLSMASGNTAQPAWQFLI